MPKLSTHIKSRKQERRRQTFTSIAILVGILVLLVVSLFLSWWINMPSRDQQSPDVELTESQFALAADLERDVRHLAETIGERNMHRRGTLDVTAEWIEEQFQEMGVETTRHTYQLQRGVYQGRSSDNIIAEFPGTETPDQIVIVGAHYDTVPNSPGANDNSSGVAVLLALAEWTIENHQPKTVRFVVFTNEEQPFYQTEDMGSYVYAEELKNRDEQITAMFSMDGIGYFSDEPGSQHYPFPGIGLIYPDKANFIGFVTRFSDLRLMQSGLSAFRENATIPAEGVALPEFVPGVSWSDHWSFWQHGFPAFLVTDTLPFRDPNYHSAADTPDELDFERMALVVDGLKSVIENLASNQ